MRYLDFKVLSSDIVLKKELNYSQVLLTSGSVNDIICRFDFSDDWNDFHTVIAVFKGSGNNIAVVLNNNSAQIPWECLSEPNTELFLGLVGIGELQNGNSLHQITTEYISLGIITPGADIDNSDLSNTPTPDIAAQLTIQINDIIDSENQRIQNENDRITAENARSSAELSRASNLSELNRTMNALTTFVYDMEYDLNEKFDTLYNTVEQLLEQHSESNITSQNGVHGLRYVNNNFEIFDNNSWQST